MSAMFRSFSIFNYRVWFIGALVSNIGAWMQATALSWVVLTALTDNDAGAMGITMALQFAPPLLLVGVTGWVADRFDRRKLLMLTQSLLLLVGLVIGALLLADVMTLGLMYGFALLLGVISAFDNPSRQAFVSDLVSRENASNAVALNAASFNGARMIGPAVAGVVIVAVGTGWVFFVNAVTFLAMIGALMLIRTDELIPRVKAPGASRLADGFRYVGKRPDLMVAFAMVFLLGAFGMNFPIFASTMALEFGQEADGYGLLSSILAVGSLIGALLAARRDRARIRVVILGTLMFAVAITVSAFMPNYWLYALTLMLTGFAVVTTLTTANGYVQTTTDPALRGRVLALYMAILMGGTPLGAPIVGWVAAEFGPRAAILLGAVAAFVAFAIGATWMLVSGRVRRSETRRFGVTLGETRPVAIVPPEAFSDEIAGTTPIRLPDDRERDARAAREARERFAG
ncbi:MFS transporter [Microbacterium sp. zg.Y1090]|nr:MULTISPECIES: MFS transporter [unclassified Microbacterium]MCR2812308.1 MFS transporter [Microbacterium sp. zg.Y1084]MCR2819802.1 MFS transporter [Microbacterium sp. zg.Y1090]MDL5485465.1 MFS transporter [Microbacterium sp. zg-Y1211]WIM28640.1 MFS transporter [Microbacterium sp. zg-Y1090]